MSTKGILIDASVSQALAHPKFKQASRLDDLIRRIGGKVGGLIALSWSLALVAAVVFMGVPLQCIEVVHPPVRSHDHPAVADLVTGNQAERQGNGKLVGKGAFGDQGIAGEI